jgi:hypothetical protein
LTIRLIYATEDDGVGWTDLDTSWLDLTVLNLAAFRTSQILRSPYSLDAKGALFHDTATTDGDIRIELIVQWIWSFPISPVKNTHLVGAVVGTITRPYTAVVNLGIDFLRLAMNGSKDWAYRFTGRASTLLAKDRLERCSIDFRILPLPETFDPNPLHTAAIPSILFTHKGNIVFHGTCRHTGLTSGA